MRQAVLFDFDYTLADSSDGIIASVNHALLELGIPTATPDAICATVGMSFADTLVRLAGDAGMATEFERRFIEHADEVM